jgi:hypothetical protein
MRIRYLLSLKKRVDSASALQSPPRLFVSFSKQHGSVYYEKVKKHAAALDLEINDGFQRTDDPNVLTAVRAAITESTLFLAILTPELAIGGGRKTTYAPSVWVMEEKGMALALKKPVRLLVHENVHRDFWLRTTPSSLHHVFKKSDFDVHCRSALQALRKRYDEIQLAQVGFIESE